MLKFLGYAFVFLSAALALGQSQPARPQLVVDASSATGAIRHGATGWLYGQSQPGIPPVHMMNLLKPQISAQKPGDGLQHPGGDAMELMPSFKAAGGKLMQIYIQDIYTDWPYNDYGLDDYLPKVERVAREVAADPNRASFVYVPFNEPDNNWYGYSGPKFDRFLHDWLIVYRKIRSIDSTAKIAGPNFEHLKPATYEAFFTFARDNHVLPDETTWHELHDDSFTDWYTRYDAYRAMEKRLGIGPIPIVINEYTRDRGDLAIPGNLIQWITRLENSKVDGCLAFWTPTGTMADLTARIWPNQATGGWWVYYWYAEMTGQTLNVTPPNRNAFGLQGIATTDPAKQQLRILFGGTGEGVDVKLDGLAAIPYLRSAAHMALWRIASSGIQPSPGPQLVSQSDLPIVDGQAHLAVASTDASSAYYAVLTPASSQPSTENQTSSPAEYPAIYATLSGRAKPSYQLSGGTVTGFATGPASATFPVTAESDGYYTATLRYLAPHSQKLGLRLNGNETGSISLPAAQFDRPGHRWGETQATLFLAGGINSLTFRSTPHAGANIELLALDLAPASGPTTVYSASDAGKTLSSGAIAHPDDNANTAVDLPAGAAPASLRFNHVSAPATGKYKLVITYSNDEKAHGGTVDEPAQILINGSAAIRTYFRQTFSSKVFCTTVIDIALKAGDNTVQITADPHHRGPTIRQIMIARARLP